LSQPQGPAGPDRWLPEFADIFATLHLEWAVIGGLGAVRYRSTPRDTTDLDFVINSAAATSEALEHRGYTVRIRREDDGTPYLLQGETTDGTHFDIYEAHTEFEKNALARRIANYVTAEDLIVYKLLAWRAQDRDDIAQILVAQPSLNQSYIGRWADAWDIRERWLECLSWQADNPERADGLGL